MAVVVAGSFGAQLKALRESAGYTQEELATIAGLSVHAISALERGERRRPHAETIRALSVALDLSAAARDALLKSARPPTRQPRTPELITSTIPVAPTPLIGRDSDVRLLKGWLDDPASRLITLTGPGGAGKTRLAMELAASTADAGGVRVVFVPLAATRDPTCVAPAIGASIGLADVTMPELPNRMREVSRGRPTLLILDNFEHVLDAAPLVADLLTSAPSLRVLATSRAALRVRGEREYPVGPLALDYEWGAPVSDDPFDAPAVRLFAERVRDVCPDFDVTSDNSTTVTSICRRLDALPLALELAAPWMKVLTIEDLLHRLQNGLLLTMAAARDVPERQRTMNATVAWSYQLVPPEEQRLFRRLGMLPGRFTVDAAAAVLAGRDDVSDDHPYAVLDAIAGLIAKSLLSRADTSVPSRPMYHMLDTVRAFAAKELAASGEGEDAAEGLVRYCVGEATQAALGLTGVDQAQWLDRLCDDLDNYRTAFTWLIERDRAADAAAIAWGLVMLWLVRGLSAEGLRWSEQVLRLPSLDASGESRVRSGVALLHYSQGALDRARDDITRALQFAETVGEPYVIGQAQTLFGHIEHAADRPAVACEWFSKAIGGFRRLGVPWAIGTAMSGLAGATLAIGEADEAGRLLLDATAALHGAGPWFLTPVLCFRATLAVGRGRAAEAFALLRESLACIRTLKDQYAFVYALAPLAAAAILEGDAQWAARILGARDAVAKRTGATVVVRIVDELHERAAREARERLGPDRWSRAYAAGRRTSIDALLGEIDRALETASA